MLVPPVALVRVTVASDCKLNRKRKHSVTADAIRLDWRKQYSPILHEQPLLAEKARTLGFTGKRFDPSWSSSQSTPLLFAIWSLVSLRWTSQYGSHYYKKSIHCNPNSPRYSTRGFPGVLVTGQDRRFQGSLLIFKR